MSHIMESVSHDEKKKMQKFVSTVSIVWNEIAYIAQYIDEDCRTRSCLLSVSMNLYKGFSLFDCGEGSFIYII